MCILYNCIHTHIFTCTCIYVHSCCKSSLLCGGGPFIRDGESTQWMIPLMVVEKCLGLQLPSIALWLRYICTYIDSWLYFIYWKANINGIEIQLFNLMKWFMNIHTYVKLCIHAYVCASIHTYTYIHTCTQYSQIQIKIKCTYACTYISYKFSYNTHTHTHTHTRTHTHTHTHTRTHTHTQL